MGIRHRKLALARLGAAFRLAFRGDIMRRSFKVAAVVGTILNLINQGDAFLGAAPVDPVKAVLTFIVPYCVATYGAVCALSALSR